MPWSGARGAGCDRRKIARGRPSRIDADLVRRLVKQHPDLVLCELQQDVLEAGTRVSIAHLARVLGRLGLRLKKVAPCHRAQHQRKPPPPRSLPRAARPDRARRPDLSGRERGFLRNDPHLRAGAVSPRVHDTKPGGTGSAHHPWVRWTGHTGHDGLGRPDREVFLTHLDQVLCPKLRPDHVVVLNNLSAHKSTESVSASSRPVPRCCTSLPTPPI